MAHDTGSWSRAFMASTGMSLSQNADNQRATSPEWHEAINPDLDRARLMELATSRSTAIREAIASRSDCPLGVLAALAHDHRTSVRCEVAANPSMPRAIAEVLMRDRDASVLKAIARNDAAPQDVVAFLAAHRKEDVRRVASKRRTAEEAAETLTHLTMPEPEGRPERPAATFAPRPDVRATVPGVSAGARRSTSFLPVTR
ncbi:hypothetical protein [Demequina aurantiaca]|uniref:hypothetical protein n=1 Tax=Demequina aurantiaca TaxID=676200 RepID=UPI003D3357BB